MLAQRYVDRLRASRRVEPLPDEDSPAALPAPPRAFDPDRDRYVTAVEQALARAVANLPARDRLRLACYYAQELTLAETGRIVGEHEATVSRQLARTRRAIRADVERSLRTDAGMADADIAQCFASVAEDAGRLDLGGMLEVDGPTASRRKKSAPDRSR